MRAGIRTVLLPGVVVLALILPALGATAQVLPCDASPHVTEALGSLPRSTGDSRADRDAQIAAFRTLLKRFPSDVYLHQRYQDTAKYPTVADRDAVIAEYDALLKQHPKDAGFQFLAARIRVGVSTKDVLPQLEALAPHVPRAHLTLIQIYQAPLFKDAKKVREHLEAFVRTCPDSLSAYQYFDSLEPPSDFLTQGVAHLRTLLQHRRDPESFGSWSTLWSLEFRVKAAAEHETVRKQVAEDLKRLRAIDPGKNASAYYSTLQEGYKLTADTDGAKWALEQNRKATPSSAFYEMSSQWSKEHPYPKPNDPPEKRQAYYEAYARATADWTRDFPDTVSAWFGRVNALGEADSAAPGDVEMAGESLLKLVARKPNEMMFVSSVGGSSYSLLVAHLYATRSVRPDRLQELVKQGIVENQAPMNMGLPSDLYPASTNQDPNRDYREWASAMTVADIWLKVKDKQRAREAVAQMEALARKSKPKPDVKDATESARQRASYLSRQGEYWRRMGDLTQIEGSKIDAMTFYQNALLARTQPPAANQKDELAEKARALWKDMGGSNEAWQAWSDRSKELLGQPVNAEALSRWTSIEKKLPDFKLTDLTGKVWDLAALKGKITMINVWAST